MLLPTKLFINAKMAENRVFTTFDMEIQHFYLFVLLQLFK